MPVNSYRFRSVWSVAAPPGEVYDVLADLRGYLDWWPEVREGRQIGEQAAELRCRSLLPYDLVFEVHHNTSDRERLLLRADLVGDLDGTVGWTLLPEGEGTRVVYDQEVVVRKPLLRLLGLPARPLLKANHELMMRHGRRGLETYLAGLRAARQSRVREAG
ncbi:SRPBCC family protein [Saccharothrix coeruleofusca]|uniref:SRPBCC family protein n=1 Tax=Saccharothrix coeruleofusca TaxID=33919 RepID=UPI00167080A0|nr:SRPBCC family protein [Saccharothrix coeruleofusca]